MRVGNTVVNFKLSEETLKRCAIIELPADKSNHFRTVNPELFHLLREIRRVDFSIFLRVDRVLIEYIKPSEFCAELLEQLWQAMERANRRLDIQVANDDFQKFERAIAKSRQIKVNRLLEKDPHLDRKTIEVFANLSAASQLVVKGGISSDVALRVQQSAAYMVDTLFDSDAAIATLSRMVTHDPTLYDHSASVAMLAGVIAGQCIVGSHHLERPQVEVITQSGLYHDVGKTCVPSAILNKPGRFTAEEFAVMQSHTSLGEQELARTIAEGAPIDKVCVRVAGEHHERFCGHGYPQKRRGRLEENPENGIHLYSRIVAIADVYSALLMKRVYKKAYEPQDAIKIMAETAEQDYDPDIFIPFVRSVVESLNSYTREQKINKENIGRILVFTEDGRVDIISPGEARKEKDSKAS